MPYIKINECRECIFCEIKNAYLGTLKEHFVGYNYFCKKEDKIICKYIYGDNKVNIPSWCPLLLKEENKNEQTYLRRLLQGFEKNRKQ